MSKEQCAGCRFWEMFPVDVDAAYKRGTCRRNPPVIDPLAINEEIAFYKENGKDAPDETAHCPTMWTQASTWEHEWCGEFQPEKQESPPKTGKTPIREAGLSTLLANSLAGGEFTTVEDALARTDRELLNLQNFGKKCLKELREWKLKNQPASKSTT